MKSRLNIPVILIVILFLCVLPACSQKGESTVVRDIPENEDLTEPDTPVPPEAEKPTEPMEEPTEPPEEPEGPEWVPSGPLSTSGPWYVVANEEGLYAFNMDGSGLTLLTRDEMHRYNTLAEGVGKTGGRIAYLTARNTYDDLTLHIIDLGKGLDHTAISLTTDETDPSKDPDDWDKIEMARSIADMPSYAWSNDGKLLAFFAAIEGPTSDLYVYSPAEDSITRLTSGPSQGFHPVWSPDDEYIAHVGAGSFGSGAGYDIQGIWAAKVDGSKVVPFEFPENTGDERIIGWLDDVTFLGYSWYALHENYYLRFNNIRTGEVDVIWEYPFTVAVAGSPDNFRILLALNHYASEKNPEGLRGLYYLDPPDFEPDFSLGTDTYIISWCEAGFFVVSTMDGYIEIRGRDRMGPYPMEGDAIYSDDGFPAWYANEGLWINVSGTAKKLFTGSVEEAAWGADSESILFATEDSLYVAKAPDWKPILVAAMFPTDEIVLVMP